MKAGGGELVGLVRVGDQSFAATLELLRRLRTAELAREIAGEVSTSRQLG